MDLTPFDPGSVSTFWPKLGIPAQAGLHATLDLWFDPLGAYWTGGAEPDPGHPLGSPLCRKKNTVPVERDLWVFCEAAQKT